LKRLAVEKDAEAQAVMSQAQKEEFIHFGIDLEFCCGVRKILFRKGDLIELAEKAEETIEED
jgi:uncharacterized protein